MIETCKCIVDCDGVKCYKEPVLGTDLCDWCTEGHSGLPEYTVVKLVESGGQSNDSDSTSR